MGIDINAIKQKLQDIKDGVGSGSGMRNDFWKPKPGDEVGAQHKKKYKVRIVPFVDPEDGLPFMERWFYYEFRPAILALHKMGQPDPVRELQQKLYEDGSDAAKETAKKLWPRDRHFAAVIVRPDPDNSDEMNDNVGVKLWGFSATVRDVLLEKFVDADYGDITDPLEGHDIVIESWKESGFRGYKTKVEVRPRKTPLLKGVDKKRLKELQAEIPDLTKIYTVPTYEDVTRKLDAWASGGEGSNGSNGSSTQDVGSAGTEKNTKSQKLSDGASGDGDDADDKLAKLEENTSAPSSDLDKTEAALDAEFEKLKSDASDLDELPAE